MSLQRLFVFLAQEHSSSPMEEEVEA
jgi:hypothetical protein